MTVSCMELWDKRLPYQYRGHGARDEVDRVIACLPHLCSRRTNSMLQAYAISTG